jgi:hypothetical protein
MTATLRVRRVRNSWALLRRLVVLVDGEKAGMIRPGKTATIEVAAGIHSVAVRMDWVQSPAVEATCVDGTTTDLDAFSQWFLAALVNEFLRPSRVFRLEPRTLP